MTYSIILFIHILSATVWTGGHLVLAITILPNVLRNKAVDALLEFESGYEKIGIPALIIQVITGVWLAFFRVPEFSEWFNFANPFSVLICTKLTLLLITVGFALDARFRVIPNLSPQNLRSLAFHIIPVTIVSVLFVYVGVAFRSGYLFS